MSLKRRKTLLHHLPPLNAPVGFLKADERMLRCKLFTVPASNWRNHLPMWVQELKVKGTKTKGASIPGEGRDPQYPWSTVQLIKVFGLSQPQSQGTSQIPGAAWSPHCQGPWVRTVRSGNFRTGGEGRGQGDKGRRGHLQPCIRLASCSAHSFLSSIKGRWRYSCPVIPSAELHLSGSEPCSHKLKISKLSHLGQILL